MTKDPALSELLSETYSLTPVTGITITLLEAGAAAGLLSIRNRRARDEAFLGPTPGLTSATGAASEVSKRRGKVNAAIAFQLPKGAPPGKIGTLTDVAADSMDISTTIADPAVRGCLVMTALPGGGHQSTRSRKKLKDLAGYEKQPVADIFKAGKTVILDQFRHKHYVGTQSRTRNDLYKRVISREWFHDNPQKACKSALKLGIFLTIAGLVDSLFVRAVTGWGLILLPVALLGVGLIFLAHRFRACTAQGSAMLAQARGFELYLHTAEKEQLRFKEGANIFSRYLPYAMILGIVGRRTKLFAKPGGEGSYQVDTPWCQGMDLYHSVGMLYTNLNSFSHNFLRSLSYVILAEKAAQMAQSTQSSSSGPSGNSGFSGGGRFSDGDFSGGSR